MSLAGAAAQGALGLFQAFKGSMMKPKRPTYDIPDEIGENVSMYKNFLNARMAGGGYAENNIMSNQGTMLDQIRKGSVNSSQLLSMIGGVQGNTNRSFERLNQIEAEDQQRRAAGVAQARNTMARFRDKAFEMNEMQPYMDQAATKSALIGGGLRNMYGGLNSITQYGMYKELNNE